MRSRWTGTGPGGRARRRAAGDARAQRHGRSQRGMRRLLPVLAAGVAVTALAACANVPAGPGPAALGTATGPAAPAVPAAQVDPGLPDRLAAAVSGDAAYAHLQELERIADAHGGDRAVGTPGYDASVDYVSGKLREAGYEVRTPSFDVRSFTANAARLTVADAPVPTEVLSFSPATPPGGLTAPLSVRPRTPQDPTPGCEAADYAGIPAGAIAVVERGVCPFGQKSQLAGAAGAAAMIVVNTEDAALPATLGETPDVVPTAAVQKTAGAALRDGQQATLVLDTTIQQQTSRNVIAETTTGDPNRVVMAGAHLDSVPEGAGINDNGSGSAALLEVAQKLGAAPPAGQKVRFAWWGAEEIGLVGATRYVESLSEQDRAALALYLNFDMVGSPNAGYLVYDGDNSDGLGGQAGPPGSETAERVLTEALAAAGVPGPETTAFDGRSDYGPFIEAGIPAGGLFTGAEELKTPEQAQKWGGTAGQSYDSCYHTPCDRLTNIDRTALDRNLTAMGSAVGRFAVDLTGVPAR
ncbi:M28 family metallopeptidase [Pseudonocardia parietis]|uniref:Zn-dependent M28 family amino/carboxypeptidase n=1 Tax=Pseudonocardia parietis TaxID=570936 RepID=A0ABS4VPR6_9PSEU|nr:M28 family metallopeptidase [Pseudonocardia parietis]MBP2365912.1 Zn-dependent M28 family amino/carboxypeptidase [Pseudonocardia parietis]